MHPIDTILFDLDGTLIDSSEGVVCSFNYVFRRIGVPLPDPSEIKATIGYPLDESFRRFTDHDPDECYRLFQEKAVEVLIPSAVLLPGVEDTVRRLFEHGYRLGVATTKNRNHLVGILDHLNIARYFQDVSGGDEVKNVKPDPEILLLTLRKLDRPANTSAYVGDTVLDIRAARDARMTAISVLGGTSSREEIENEAPDVVLDDIRKLIDMFEGPEMNPRKSRT